MNRFTALHCDELYSGATHALQLWAENVVEAAIADVAALNKAIQHRKETPTFTRSYQHFCRRTERNILFATFERAKRTEPSKRQQRRDKKAQRQLTKSPRVLRIEARMKAVLRGHDENFGMPYYFSQYYIDREQLG